jgi:hypothetical protein
MCHVFSLRSRRNVYFFEMEKMKKSKKFLDMFSDFRHVKFELLNRLSNKDVQ